MGVSEKFSKFCENLRMSNTTVSNISSRAKIITKRINSDFRGIDSDIKYSLFVGSYGRGTDIHVSDIDMIIELPYLIYQQYNSQQGNGQSALIQAVKNSIQKTYSKSYVRGDGQVIKVNFTDGICFEILPGFINKDSVSYTYPDTHNGGSWKVTKPRDEINAINNANKKWNKNLKRLCRMTRSWKEEWNVSISGLLIDTLAYNFLNSWEYNDKSFMYYDWMTRDFLRYLSTRNPDQTYWVAPGSNQYVLNNGNFVHKAKRCYNISIEALSYESDNREYSANEKWKEIYGSKFTD